MKCQDGKREIAWITYPQGALVIFSRISHTGKENCWNSYILKDFQLIIYFFFFLISVEIRPIKAFLSDYQQHFHCLQRSWAWRDIIADFNVNLFIKTTHYSPKRVVCYNTLCTSYWSYIIEHFLFSYFIKATLHPVLTFHLPDLAPSRVRVPGHHVPYDCVDGGIFLHFQLVDGFGENRWFVRILDCNLHRCRVLEGSTAAGFRADVGGFHFEDVSPFALIVQRLFGFIKKKIDVILNYYLLANNKPQTLALFAYNYSTIMD